MWKKMTLILTIIGLMCVGTGCMTLIHEVGDGAQGAQLNEERQWYALWGLVPLNEVDSQEMAEGATDYTITSEMTFIDGLISAVLGFVTIQAQTVTVEY